MHRRFLLFTRKVVVEELVMSYWNGWAKHLKEGNSLIANLSLSFNPIHTWWQRHLSHCNINWEPLSPLISRQIEYFQIFFLKWHKFSKPVNSWNMIINSPLGLLYHPLYTVVRDQDKIFCQLTSLNIFFICLICRLMSGSYKERLHVNHFWEVKC